jgi:hypothetical protein
MFFRTVQSVFTEFPYTYITKASTVAGTLYRYIDGFLVLKGAFCLCHVTTVGAGIRCWSLGGFQGGTLREGVVLYHSCSHRPLGKLPTNAGGSALITPP